MSAARIWRVCALVVCGIASVATAQNAPTFRSGVRLIEGRWGFKMEIGLLDVDPGRYVVTVEAMSARRSAPERRSLVVAVED